MGIGDWGLGVGGLGGWANTPPKTHKTHTTTPHTNTPQKIFYINLIK